MAVSDDIQRLHDRIDELDKVMGKRHLQLVTSLHNLDKRIDRLEVAAGSRRTWLSFLAAAVISLLSAMLGGGIVLQM